MLGLLLTGCTFIPGAGPTTNEISQSRNDGESSRYELIDVNEDVISQLRWRAEPSLLSLSDYKEAEPVIGVGDVVRVTLWEAAPGNLFTASMGQGQSIGSVGGSSIPEQVVPRAGTIVVPFAGPLKVVGRTPREVEKAIVQNLSTKAVQPQALVNVVRSTANSVIITGDAVGGGQMQLTPNGERVLDAIASAGGVRTPIHETYVSLSREGKIVTVPFTVLTSNAAENVRLGPRDVVFVTRRPRSYTILGATGHNAEVPFDVPSISLAQAIARAGGLSDERADSSGVFVFRLEPQAHMAALHRNRAPALGAAGVPVIYRLDLHDPRGMFLAQQFPIRGGDMIYVSNAEGAELTKILKIASTVFYPAITSVSTYSSLVK